MKHGKLRTGQIIRNVETKKTGVIIDWGLKNVKFLGYMPLPAYNKMADAVRVWTSSGKTIEVWPLASVATEDVR
jgi:hypothetical protein